MLTKPCRSSRATLPPPPPIYSSFGTGTIAPAGGLDWREAVPLSEIRPTQMAVGLHVVEMKRRKIERHLDNARKLRRYLDKRPVPAVIGPDEEYYIIDHHHLSYALWQCEVDEVIVRVVGDLSDMPKRDFLRTMSSLGWLHAYDAEGRKVCASRLPRTIDQLKPDRYRDLAWTVRQAGGFCKTEIPFSEFTWANYFRTCIGATVLTRDFNGAHAQAMRFARMKGAAHLPGFIPAD